MPRIPGFETRSRIGMNVPETPEQPTSQMGKVLSGIGGEVTKFGVELEKRRKLAADSRDVAQKTLDLESNYLQQSLQLKNARREDGTLREDVVGWKDKEKGIRYKYSDKVEEFWNKSLKEYSKTMASPEAESQFFNKVRPRAKSEILKAEAETLTMEAVATRTAEKQTHKAVTNGILVNPEADVDTLEVAAAGTQESHAGLMEDGLIDEVTYNAEKLQRSRDMTLAMLDNLVRTKRPDEIISLIYAGNFPGGDYEKNLEAAQSVWEKLGIQEIKDRYQQDVDRGLMTQDELNARVSTIKKRVKMNPDAILKYRGRAGIEELSGSLNRKEIERYLRLAGKIKVDNNIHSRDEVVKDLKSNNNLWQEGALDINDPEDREKHAEVLYRRFKIDANDLDDPDVMASLTHDYLGSVMARNTYDIADQLLYMEPKQKKEFIQALKDNPLMAAESLLEDGRLLQQEASDPEVREGMRLANNKIQKALDGGVGSQIIAENFVGFGQKIEDRENKRRMQMMEDPGGLFNSQVARNDPNLMEPGPARMAEMDGLFRRYEVPPHYRKYASKARIKDFKVKFDSLDDGGKTELMINTRREWGGVKNWMKVQDQYVKEAGLPETMSLAFMMPDPDSMERMIGVTLPERAKFIREQFEAGETGYAITDVATAVRENELVEEFSIALSSGRDSTLEAMKPTQEIVDALTNYTLATYQPGADSAWIGNNALERTVDNTVNQILEKNFNIVGDGESTIIAPTMPAFSVVTAEQGRMQTPSMEELEGFLRSYTPDKIAEMVEPPENFERFAQDFLALDPQDLDKPDEIWERTIESNMYWATLPDMSGVGLRFRTKSNAQVSSDPKDPFSNLVPGKDGKPITLEWGEIAGNPAFLEGVQ